MQTSFLLLLTIVLFFLVVIWNGKNGKYENYGKKCTSVGCLVSAGEGAIYEAQNTCTCPPNSVVYWTNYDDGSVVYN